MTRLELDPGYTFLERLEIGAKKKGVADDSRRPYGIGIGGNVDPTDFRVGKRGQKGRHVA